MIHSQTVQPELQLNMNSQGGFVPQFINHTNRSETVPSPIQSDSSSIQVPFMSMLVTLVLSSISQTDVTKIFEQISLQFYFSQTQPGHHQVFQKTAGQSITLHWIKRIIVGHLTQTRLLIGRAVTIPVLLQMTMILIWIRKSFNKSPLSELNLKIRLRSIRLRNL